MIVPLWGVTEGPEWAASCAQANPGHGRFDEMIAAARMGIQHNPFGHGSKDFGSRDQRTVTAADPAAGYRIIIFFVVAPGGPDRCTLVWVACEGL